VHGFRRKLRCVLLLENPGKAVHVAQWRSQIVRYGIRKSFQLEVCFLKLRGAQLHAVLQILVQQADLIFGQLPRADLCIEIAQGLAEFGASLFIFAAQELPRPLQACFEFGTHLHFAMNEQATRIHDGKSKDSRQEKYPSSLARIPLHGRGPADEDRPLVGVQRVEKSPEILFERSVLRQAERGTGRCETLLCGGTELGRRQG
jgi:hypothetical protein